MGSIETTKGWMVHPKNGAVRLEGDKNGLRPTNRIFPPISSLTTIREHYQTELLPSPISYPTDLLK
jgi:hypothetical protein